MEKNGDEYTPARGDIIWFESKGMGHEQVGKRPGLVISNSDFNKTMGICIICPITSKIRALPFHELLSGDIYGSILTEQIRSIDFRARNVTYASNASRQIVNAVIDKLTCILQE